MERPGSIEETGLFVILKISMYVVTVTPLAQTAVKENLTYFSAERRRVGSVVSVPLRTKEIPALVLKTEKARNAKSRIRTGSFGIRKIGSTLSDQLFSPALMRAAEDTAAFYASSLGGVLKHVTPQVVLDSPLAVTRSPAVTGDGMVPERLVLQASLTDRISYYKRHIREVLARSGSVFICVPTRRHALFLGEQLRKGIEHHTLVLHGKVPNSDIRTVWETIQKGEPKLIIATPLFLSIPHPSIDTFVLESESSELYYTSRRPLLNTGYMVRLVAEYAGARFVAADTVLSLETRQQYEAELYSEAAPLQGRYRGSAQVQIVDMTQESAQPGTHSEAFQLLSPELLSLIEGRPSEHAFVYTARRGLAPTVSCSDCGYTFSCEECGAPVVLHEKRDTRLFICHSCGLSADPTDSCPQCRSWRLKQLGVGSSKVTEILKEAFPKRDVLCLDSDSASTERQETKIWNTFQESRGAILVGTELAVNHIRLSELEIATTAVASIDSLLTYPNYSSGERVFRILTELRFRATEFFLVQTRIPQQRLLEHIKHGTVTEFLREEADARKRLSYPPFSVPITITFSGYKTGVTERRQFLEEAFSSFEPLFYPVLSGTGRGGAVFRMLIRISPDSWPNADLSERLKSLPAEYKVAVHPPTLM